MPFPYRKVQLQAIAERKNLRIDYVKKLTLLTNEKQEVAKAIFKFKKSRCNICYFYKAIYPKVNSVWCKHCFDAKPNSDQAKRLLIGTYGSQ